MVILIDQIPENNCYLHFQFLVQNYELLAYMPKKILLENFILLLVFEILCFLYLNHSVKIFWNLPVYQLLAPELFFLEKIPATSLYWLAAQQQTSTLKRQKMFNFTQNSMQSSMNLVPASQSYRKRSKI